MANLKSEVDCIHPQPAPKENKEKEPEIKQEVVTVRGQSSSTITVTAGVLEMEREKQTTASPKKLTSIKKKEENKEKDEPLKRMRLELLPQIKYTLIYDEQVDRAGIDKVLNEYEEKMHRQNILELEASKKEQVIDAISGEVIDVTTRSSRVSVGDDLFREIQEEEKLDE